MVRYNVKKVLGSAGYIVREVASVIVLGGLITGFILLAILQYGGRP